MRCVFILLACAGLASSQAMTDAAAMIAGGSVGGAAGKKVSDGISNVLQKVDGTAAKAAKPVKTSEMPVQKAAAPKASSGTLLQVGSGAVVKDHSLVPPPPVRKAAAVVVPPPPPIAPVLALIEPTRVAPPPPPQVTLDDLKLLASGTPRGEVLKLGPPASRVTMYDDGHLVEIYRYQTRDTIFGVVRLSDGAVSNVSLP
jgi:hypothetical protein